MPDSITIAVIQFPGSNTERETALALRRAGIVPLGFLWNEPHDKLTGCDGYVITGGFSYEDRSRAGVIASLDPLMNVLRQESEKGKPVLGICNGAQTLVEAGLVPGLKSYSVGMALTKNKRTKKGHILGTGYYNTWTNVKLAVPAKRTAFTRNLKAGDWIHIPLAHAEGRFMIPEELLIKIQDNNQAVLQYCDHEGQVLPEFPVNPNGSIHNLAAVCNPGGNVMAIMPHPERTPDGDTIFTSMRDYIHDQPVVSLKPLAYTPKPVTIKPYSLPGDAFEWVVDLIITDNEAISVHNALAHLDIPVVISRKTHWEIATAGADRAQLGQEIAQSGELFNSNKEILVSNQPDSRSATFLVRHKEDLDGRQKREVLTDRFSIHGIRKIRKGVLWTLSADSANFESVLKRVLDTHILFNPVSHDCFRYD